MTDALEWARERFAGRCVLHGTKRVARRRRLYRDRHVEYVVLWTCAGCEKTKRAHKCALDAGQRS